MKRKKKWWGVIGVMCLFPLVIHAQQIEPLTHPKRLFDDGKELFLRHEYAAAQQTLKQYLKTTPEASLKEEISYMLACIAFELDSPERIAKLESFLKEYPYSRYVNRVRSLVASAYFFENKYEKAISEFEQCNVDMLSNTERDACIFRQGLAYLGLKDYQEAFVRFSILNDISAEYEADASYYLGYINYVRQQYDEALKQFQSVETEEKYARLAPYYIADIYLIQQQYEKALQMASGYLNKYPYEEKAFQMKRVLGESCYELKNYQDAIKYLEVYCGEEGKGAKRSALYRLGMSFFHVNVYAKASQYLGETITKEDALSQSAYMYMGLCYLQLKDHNRARMAFEQASSMKEDRYIQEQALYNYALCIHETSYSPFAESVTVFERFLNEFPNSEYVEKVNNYLVEVYLNTRSYEAALRSIDKISNPGERILAAKQKLLFRMGTQEFAQAAFDKAIDYFSQSLQLGRHDQQTKADAYYWRGESKYRLNQYDAASNDFRLYLEFAVDKKESEYGLALYNLGYTAFKQKLYDSALQWFTRCTQSGTALNSSVLADAYNRMGDCNFYHRRFDAAQQLYGEAAKTDKTLGDYSLFQMGFVKGLQRDYEMKIQLLDKLLATYPSSLYIDDALYEQGRAYVQLEDNQDAIKRYSILVERYPDSPLSRKAANEIGLLYYQDDKYQDAIVAYKKVISTYPGSEEAQLAQRDLKSIYIDMNDIDSYANFIASVPGGTRMAANEHDSLTYVAAERIYMKGDMQNAKSSFLNYLQSFPTGAFSVNADYYLGIICYNEKNYPDAKSYLAKVMEYPDNQFSGEAMQLCAEMTYNDKEYVEALSIYKRMIDRATSVEEKQNALVGAMRCAWLSEKEEDVLTYSTMLLTQSKSTPEVANEAYYYRAKTCLKGNKKQEAIADLSALAKDTRNVYGAEAKYLLAQLYFDEGQADKAEKEVLDYIEVSTPHAYWLARSFILLSDIYMEMGRELDAKQYLLSLKQNYQADDDIAEMIETRLVKLNKEE